MAIVITNGRYYIRYTDTGATKKISDISFAYRFPNVNEAIKSMKQAKGKTQGYYVYDTQTQRIVWKWLTKEERLEVRKRNLARLMVKRDDNGEIIRKIYSYDTRKMIYNNANGRCELCGRNILFEDMTIDHIDPLSMGGADDVKNLACTCYPCNLFKGNILPDDFMERITEILMYQMEKKYSGKLRWKVIQKLLKGMA